MNGRHAITRVFVIGLMMVLSRPALTAPAVSTATDAQTLAALIAQRHQIPPVSAQGYSAGPFPGPDGSIYFVNRQGLMTFYLPSANAGYLARPGTPLTFLYGFNVTGYYQFTPEGPKVVSDPAIMLPWPHAVTVANAVVARYYREQQAGDQSATGNSSRPGTASLSLSALRAIDNPSLQRLSELSAQQHQTLSNILQNLGSDACTPQYSGLFYLGCW